MTISGQIANGSGTVALTKTGAGTLNLTGTNAYGGATTVNGGSLIITNGGFVKNAAGVVGSALADSNAVVTVTGAGSRWTVTGGTLDGFIIGQGSSFNSVIVTNQGTVTCDGTQIGNNIASDRNCGVTRFT
jgi:autotransporter-associated beta strand protein